MTKKAKRKTVTVKSNDYQPSKAELEKDIRIPTTPDRLAREIMKDTRRGDTCWIPGLGK